MPYLILPERFKRQPQYPVTIDRNNPLARDLRYAINMAAPMVSPVISGNAKWIGSGFGKVFDGNAAEQANAVVLTNPPTYGGAKLAVSTARSAFILGSVRSNSAGGQYFAGVRDSTGADTGYSTLVWMRPTAPSGALSLSWGGGHAEAGYSNHGNQPLRFSGSITPDGTYTNASLFVNGIDSSISAGLTGTPLAEVATPTINLVGRTSSANRSLNGSVALALFWSRFLSDGEHKALHENPWQVFKPALANRLYFFPTAGGSSTNLTVQDATHAHSADGPVLTTDSTLAVQDAAHAHAADNLALTTDSTLAVADAAHAHAAEAPTLTLGTNLAVADASHAHAADNAALTTDSTLVVDDGLHAHAADNIVLTGDVDAPVVTPTVRRVGGGGYLVELDGKRKQPSPSISDDEEIMEILAAIMPAIEAQRFAMGRVQ